MVHAQCFRSSPRSLLSLAIFSLAALGMTGCNMNQAPLSSSTVTSAARTLHGSVYGGQQPIVGATIQLYAAGTTTGYGQGATALIASPPTTDSNGDFTITGDYTLPTPSNLYIVASGGSPGSGNPVNSHIVLMAALGGCTATTTTLSSSLFININEVTTAATVSALQTFMAAPASGNLGAPDIGAPSAAVNALQDAFETVNNLASISTGAYVTNASDYAAVDANGPLINTLADILASCVNSDPGNSSNCSTLFTDATPGGYTAADTTQTALYITLNPTHNVTPLFGLVPPSPPFVALGSSPTSFAVTTPATTATACQTSVPLGTSANYAVLAYSGVSNTGNTVVSGGNVGTSTASVTGFGPGTVTAPGTIDNANAGTAQTNLATALSDTSTTALPGAVSLTGLDLGTLTPLTPGLYGYSSSAQLTGTLTLNAQGDPNAVFIFQIGSTLTTASGAQVVLTNGAQAQNVFWRVGSSATLGTTTSFEGVVMAVASITLDTGATLQGRALANTGAVTLGDNTVDPLSVTTSSTLPNATVSVVYSQTLSATGGSGTGYTWTVASGSLPAGLSLSSAGVISGTPTTTGTTIFTAMVTDSLGNTATASFTITVN